jgi:hypothetical protein
MDNLTALAQPKRNKLLSRSGVDAKALQVKVERLTGNGTELVAQALPARTGMVWFDYTDLIHYFQDNRVPTGIQRVQIGIFRASLERQGRAEPVGTCSFNPERRCWVAVPETLLAAVCRAACHAPAGSATASPGRR